MKSLLLSVVSVFAGASLFAQTPAMKQPVLLDIHKSQVVNGMRNGVGNQITSVTDTADQYIMRATGGTFYSSQDGGYVFGTSYFYDTTTVAYYPITAETGLHFDAVGSATVTDLIFWAGAKYINGTADDITVNVYDAGTDSMPNNLLGYGSMNLADVDTGLSAVFTDIPVTTPANITGSYFVSLQYEGIDDTIGFVSTGDGDGMMEKRVRQKASADFGGNWARMGELYNFLDVDLFWAPVYTMIDDGINHFTVKNATVQPLYPTLATSEVHLDYTLTSNSSVSYYLFDLKGKKYSEQKVEQQQAGSYSQTFDVSDLAAGNYFLSITINGNKITQKVVVAK